MKVMSVLSFVKKCNFNYDQPHPNEEPFIPWKISDNPEPVSGEGASFLDGWVCGWMAGDQKDPSINLICKYVNT